MLKLQTSLQPLFQENHQDSIAAVERRAVDTEQRLRLQTEVMYCSMRGEQERISILLLIHHLHWLCKVSASVTTLMSVVVFSFLFVQFGFIPKY